MQLEYSVSAASVTLFMNKFSCWHSLVLNPGTWSCLHLEELKTRFSLVCDSEISLVDIYVLLVLFLWLLSCMTFAEESFLT